MSGYSEECGCTFFISVYGYSELNFKRPSIEFADNGFPDFLDSDEKWGRTVVDCYCIHRVLNMMEKILRFGLCNYSLSRIIGCLCVDIVTYNPCIWEDFYDDLMEDFLDDPSLGDYDENGDVYLFSNPYEHLYSLELPDLISSSRKWTFLIENICSIDNYRWVLEELLSNGDLQRWMVEGILRKFNRDLVFYNNMRKNGLLK